MNESERTGYVVEVKSECGYGFISTSMEAGERNVYFHFSNIITGSLEGLSVGTKVSYVEIPCRKGTQAVLIKPVN